MLTQIHGVTLTPRPATLRKMQAEATAHQRRVVQMAVLSKTQVNLKLIPGDGAHTGCARRRRTH
jgi:hypothetical protein